MKNLILVALIVSVMLVLSVGAAFAAPDDGNYRSDKNEEAGGSTTSSVEAGDVSGGSGGPVVFSGTDEIARFDGSTLSLRGIE